MLRTGEVFAGYTIERLLGRGGMGSVYLARHPRLPRLTAMKLLNPELFDDNEIRARFEREADLVSQLDHPNIVTVFDRGVANGVPWISMRYIEGVDAASVDVRTLPPRQAVRIVAETAAALDFAHRRGVLHRDVKPANILLERVDGGERVYLTDFGIARLRDDTGRLTQTGSFTATLAYAAPEQLCGAPLDHRADQYSLGCTLFRLLTGTVPFDATNPVAVIQGHLHAPPPALRGLRPELPPALDVVLAKAMAKNAAERFDSCADFANAAAQALDGKLPLSAAPHTPSPPPVRKRSSAAGPSDARDYLGVAPRSRWQASAGGWFAALLVVGLVAMMVAKATGDESSGAPAPTTSVRPPTTSGVRTQPTTPVVASRAQIGANAAALSAAFPGMLPATSADRIVQSGTGYNKAGCFAYSPDAQRSGDADDPSLGSWLTMWSCFGGPNKAAFGFYLYASPADAQAALDALPANDRAAVTNDSGHSYTNYTLRDSRAQRPRMVTAFTSDPARASMLMYSAGFIATDAEFMNWWKSAPLN